LTKFILLFNNNIGLPDAPISVGIVCSNSKLFILFNFPLPHDASSPYGYPIENISEF
jgi:hypothetical protein